MGEKRLLPIPKPISRSLLSEKAMIEKRKVGPYSVSPIGLGCMNLSHAYGVPPSPEQGARVLLKALELGVDFFDTAALYGFGNNETLVGNVLAPYRDQFVLASKCGMTGVDGKRVIDGRPETIKRTCEAALRRLRTEVIDLYYLHRWDKSVPVEDSVGALSELVSEGKIREIGLSEVSAETLKKAHAVHPVAALQTEYSLWSRNAEIAVLDACKALGIAFVAFSPLARGFLSAEVLDADALVDKDIRRGMPRFQGENFAANVRLIEPLKALAREAGCTPSQLSLAWVLARGEQIVPIPGTTSVAHLQDNVAASALSLSDGLMSALDALINRETVRGGRYNAATQAEIDTEEFA